MNRNNELKTNVGIFRTLYFLTFGKEEAYGFYSSTSDSDASMYFDGGPTAGSFQGQKNKVLITQMPAKANNLQSLVKLLVSLITLGLNLISFKYLQAQASCA